MSRNDYLFTSESVSEGHPDKVSDQISDAILDALLSAAPNETAAAGVHVGCETMVTTNRVILAGEWDADSAVKRRFAGSEDLEVIKGRLELIARETVKNIGYDQDSFHWDRLAVENYMNSQSPEIRRGIGARDGENEEQGAGDQGLMFGYACNETPVRMPAPITYSHQILKSMADARHNGDLPGIGPDNKSQLTVCYEDGKPVSVDKIVIAAQHDKGLSRKDVRNLVAPHVEKVLPEKLLQGRNDWMKDDELFLVNQSCGIFVKGGPAADAGLTGRKIIVDTYGGSAPHGGGAFSGKDSSKVDRSGAYAARWLAKNVVAAGLADRCLIQIAYVIGRAEPISLYVNTMETSEHDNSKLAGMLRKVASLKPRAIRDRLGLTRPIYARTAAYGHFGREPEADGGFSWEKEDLKDDMLAELG